MPVVICSPHLHAAREATSPQPLGALINALDADGERVKAKVRRWLRLGIAIERIKPGHLQQSGRHERMHLTLKHEASRPPGMNILQQQARLDAFRNKFNAERPY